MPRCLVQTHLGVAHGGMCGGSDLRYGRLCMCSSSPHLPYEETGLYLKGFLPHCRSVSETDSFVYQVNQPADCPILITFLPLGSAINTGPYAQSESGSYNLFCSFDREHMGGVPASSNVARLSNLITKLAKDLLPSLLKARFIGILPSNFLAPRLLPANIYTSHGLYLKHLEQSSQHPQPSSLWTFLSLLCNKWSGLDADCPLDIYILTFVAGF
jgi:hypothetical protein